MSNELTDFDEKPAGRPVFLTVLCIITFLYSSYSLISSINSYYTADKAAMEISKNMDKAREDVQKKAASPQEAMLQKKIMNNLKNGFDADNIRKMNMGSAVTAVFCLLGALLMWRLKKIGFYAYLAGTLIGITSPFIIFGTQNLIGIFMTVLIGFFGIIFLILYAVNLKYMK